MCEKQKSRMRRFIERPNRRQINELRGKWLRGKGRSDRTHRCQSTHCLNIVQWQKVIFQTSSIEVLKSQNNNPVLINWTVFIFEQSLCSQEKSAKNYHKIPRIIFIKFYYQNFVESGSLEWPIGVFKLVRSNPWVYARSSAIDSFPS